MNRRCKAWQKMMMMTWWLRSTWWLLGGVTDNAGRHVRDGNQIKSSIVGLGHVSISNLISLLGNEALIMSDTKDRFCLLHLVVYVWVIGKLACYLRTTPKFKIGSPAGIIVQSRGNHRTSIQLATETDPLLKTPSYGCGHLETGVSLVDTGIINNAFSLPCPGCQENHHSLSSWIMDAASNWHRSRLQLTWPFMTLWEYLESFQNCWCR